MRTFVLTIFKSHEIKQQKTVQAANNEDLRKEKRIFWTESHYKKGVNKNWMGIKRIR